MNFKGTKDTWEAKHPDNADGVYLVISKNGKIVFKVYGNGQAEANAKLGAASKDLLKACIKALQIFDKAGIKRPDFIVKAIDKAL